MNLFTSCWARGTLGTLFAVCFALTAWAQSPVTGTVISSENNEPLPGVNVVVKGTTVGTVTDIDGNYRLEVPTDATTLLFSFIGLVEQEVDLNGRSTVDVSMVEDAQQLTEVVVTAQGIEREKKALGYAVASVDGEKLEQQPQADVGRILQGKVSGANITASNGVSGSGTNIIIRGYSSISGSNQPLFVVDGVPFNSATNTDNSASDFQQGALGTSSRFLDLDPNNIANVNVLKGLSAATLYGEQGRNGVILITTKNGQGGTIGEKMAVTLNQSYFLNEIASLPDYQNNYGGGFHQNFGFFFSNWGPNFNTRGQRGIDEDGNTDHPLSRLSDPTLREQFPEFQDQRYAYRAYDDPGSFFRTGSVINTSLNIRGTGENVNYSSTFSYTRDEGFTPNNTLEKFNFGVGGNAFLANKLSLNSSFNVAITDMQTPPISASQGSSAIGQGESVFGDVFYTPRNVDLANLPFIAPLDGRPVYYRSGNDITNPNWTAQYARNTDDVTRFFGKIGLQYDLAEGINVQYRLGLDTYAEQQEWYINKGSNTQPTVTPGIYRTNNITNTIWNQDIILTGSKEINEDINVSLILGGNYRQDRFERRGIESQNQIVFNFINHSNFTSFSPFNSFSGLNIQRLQEERILAAYGEATFDYRDYLFLRLAARNDWASTLETENRSLFYPSASVSFIPTTAFGIENNTLNYLKVRFGFGQSAGYPSSYRTRNVLNSGLAFVTPGGDNLITNSNAVNLGNSDNGATADLGNISLKPELHRELELGLEAELLQNRIGLSATVYRKVTQDLITDVPIDPSTGYSLTFLNLGEIENRGIELELTTQVVVTPNFNWEVSANFFSYETTVNELGAGLDQVSVAGFTNLGNFAIPDEPFNSIVGSKILRTASGDPLIGSDGLYQQDPTPGIIGDPNPDFTASLFNTLRWKSFTLNMQWDYRKGGDIYSITANTLVGRGITQDTDFDRTQAYVLDGVVDEEGTPNRQMITATNLGFSTFIGGPDELFIYDGTTVRLREISLGYRLPTAVLDKTPFGEVSISLIANNLWYRALNFPEHVNFDTDVTSLNAGGNGLGFDFLTGPTSRRYGASVRLSF